MSEMSGILYVQRALHEAGFNPGPLDGRWGARTRTALDAALAGHKAAREPASEAQSGAQDLAALMAKQPKATRPINGIVIHCTATPEGRDHTAEEIRRWHMSPPNNWSDGGYHFVVRLDGTVEILRPEARVGSHVKEANTGTLGVVYVGGTDAYMTPKDTRTVAQKAALMALCRALIVKYPTIKWIKGHNDFTNAKACPSFKVASDPLGKIA